MAALNDVNARTTSLDVSSFFTQARYFTAIELGYHNIEDNSWKTNYHITLWHADRQSDIKGSPENMGVTISLLYNFREIVIPFLRYTHASPILKPNNADPSITNLLAMGVILPNFLGKVHNLVGLGFSYGSFSNKQPDQYVLEGFYRLQLTPSIQLSPDLQLIFNSNNTNKRNPVLVFGARARIAF